MNHKLTRRQFGQIAITGTTVAALGHLASKTFVQAQQVPSTLVGVRLGAPETDTGVAVGGSDTSDDIDNPIVDPPSRALEFININLATGQTQLREAPEVLISSGEEVTGLTSLADGTLVLAITPNSPKKKVDPPTRLTFLSTPPKEIVISGLKKQETFGSLVDTTDGRLLGLVTKKNKTPPVRVVEVNIKTGELSDVTKLKLPGNQRFSNLAQCPDGNFYAIVVGKQGDTSLSRLDQKQQKSVLVSQLKLNSTELNNGLLRLICTANGQFLAFGERRYVTPNSLFSLNSQTGALTRLLKIPRVFSLAIPPSAISS